jgi:hypothetical protein
MTDASRPEEASRRADMRGGGTHSLFGSALAAAVQTRPQAGPPGESEDAVEVWGRRIGRALGFAACVALALHLFFTYVLR